MRKINLFLAVLISISSCGYNPAIAQKITYTDYGVKTETELNSVITAPLDEDSGKRININTNINLLNDLPPPTDNVFIINGNNKTINGGGKNGFSTPPHATTTINDTTFTNFSAPSLYITPLDKYYNIGGSIVNTTGTLNIYNSYFTNNIASGDIAVGGAIANVNNLDPLNSRTINIYNSFFENNKANISTHGEGGAIYNYGTANIYSSWFKKNTTSTSDAASLGGAIANKNNLNIFNSTFGTGNVTDANQSYNGGAIYNYGGATTKIYNSSFAKNIAGNSGGAIYNEDALTAYDSSFVGSSAAVDGGAVYNSGTAYFIADKKDFTFTNNTSAHNGGAIYNSGNLYLVANNAGMTFTGNTATNLGNDIYNSDGAKLYLNAGLGDIAFNSGMYMAPGSIIYINNSIADVDELTVPTTGRVVLNSALTGRANIYLNGGMLKLGESGSINLISGELNLSGNSILNLANGNVDTVNIGAISTSTGATPNIWMDINPSNNTSDNFTASSYLLNVQPKFVFRILDDGSGDIKDISISGMNLNGINSYGYTNHYAYTFAGQDWGGFEYTRSEDGTTYDGLAGAITDTHDRSFSLVGSDYTISKDFDDLYGYLANTLTIFGKGKNGLAIDGGNSYRLLSVGSGATLNIVDAQIKNLSYGNNGLANSGNLNVYDSSFNNNTIPGDGWGGAIYNSSSGTAYLSGSDFISNTSNRGGGAIANDGDLKIYNSSFRSNHAEENGGAIYSGDQSQVKLTVSDSVFGLNTDLESNTAASGGAIFTGKIANIYNSRFLNNRAINEGGAISNASTGTLSVYNSTFYKNKANLGGAINNSSGTVSLYNSTFNNNIANDKGGAIYSNGGTVNIIASYGDALFMQNTAANGGNDIYLTNGATLNLNASQGNKISIGGGIKSSAIENGTININKVGSLDAGDPPTNAPSDGEIKLFAPIETSNVNLHGGTLTLGNDSYLNGDALTLETGTLNMQNGKAGIMALNSLTVNGLTHLKIDADLAAGNTDKIEGAYKPNVSHLYVDSIKLLSDSTTSTTTTQLLGSDLVGHNLVNMGVTKAYTPIYQYDVNYNDTTGQLTFNGGGSGGGGGSSNFNPAIISSPVSANVGAYMTQVNTYNEALGRAELFMSLPQQERLLMRYRNNYANVGGNDVQPEVFSPTFLPDERGGLWFKQYTSFENVPMNNGPNVSNVGYGAMIGADSPMYHLKHGYDGYLTTYVAYNGSHQNYDQVGVNQNGGALGVTGTLYKGNFFTALTASVGDSYGQANTMYGVDNFNTLLAGLAWKSGYNIEMAKGKFILQPSFLAAYTFANTFDYTTASGVNMTSDPMNAIQIAPGVKFIANMENGWQPYLAANMVFNIMDNQKFQANDVQLPQMSISPYFEYGLGIQRRWGERFTGFGQAMLRGGGRNGIALQFGFRIAIGK